MLYYSGTEKHLKELGFVQNVFKTYWFRPTDGQPNNHRPLCINLPSMEIEFNSSSDLNILGVYIEER